MAIGDSQDDSRVYGDVKGSLPLLQLPRANSTGNIFGGHLPLAPAQNQYLDTRPETQHQFQTTITTPVDNIPPTFTPISFSEPQERMHTPMRRASRVNVTLTIHGLEDPSNVELEWSLSTGINADQRAKIDRYVRKVLENGGGSDSKFNTPKRELSYDGSRRSSWTPGVGAVASNYRFIQQGTRRPAEYQLSRQDTPEDDEEDEEYMNMEISYEQMTHIRLGDSEQILGYYESILRSVQQLALKQILKEWIKVIEPKKQKNFPYKKPELRPKWWPDAAQYKEPDHIKVDDRIILAIGIIRHAQDLNELNGEGLSRIEERAMKEELIYDNEAPAKATYRKNLLQSMFALARAEQQVKHDERDSTETIALPQVKKFEKPNKKRKKNSDKNKSIDSDFSIKYEDNKSSNGLLAPGTLRSQGDRASTAPNTPNWSGSARHGPQDSGVCFPPADGHNPHLMSYNQSFEHAPQMERAYSSYDESPINGANSSPDSAYPSSTTSAGSMHMSYPAVSMGYSAPVHGIPTAQYQTEGLPGMMMPDHSRPQVQQVYTAVTETDRSWSATPASYMPAQPQPFATGYSY